MTNPPRSHRPMNHVSFGTKFATSDGVLKMPMPMTMPTSIAATSSVERLARGAAGAESVIGEISGRFRRVASRAVCAQGVTRDCVVLHLAAQLHRAAAEIGVELDGIAGEAAGHRHGLAGGGRGAADLLEGLLEIERELACAAFRLP